MLAELSVDTDRAPVWAHELIADATLVHDHRLIIRIVAKLAAQVLEVALQVVALVDIFTAPDLRQQRAEGQDAVLITTEVVEDAVLDRRQLDLLALNRDLAARVVDAQRAGRERRALGGRYLRF